MISWEVPYLREFQCVPKFNDCYFCVIEMADIETLDWPYIQRPIIGFTTCGYSWPVPVFISRALPSKQTGGGGYLD